MFTLLGRIISRTWLVWLAAWALLLAGTWKVAPSWQEVAKDGQFNFLPPDMPSRRGEDLLRRAFPGGRAESSVVIVAAREGDRQLTEEDRRFIADKLRPGLERIADEEASSVANRSSHTQRQNPIIVRILTFQDPEAGPLLISEDRSASLVVIDLTTDFLSRRNIPVVRKVEELIGRLRGEGGVPAGLQLALTGSTVLGRDTMVAESESARAIESWTIWLIIILLLVFYRAPFIALVPLITLYVAVQIALRILALAAQAGYVELFHGLEVYTSVVVYAAGVDYNLFLISRYEEEAAGEPGIGQALARAVGRIGGALAASAATVICGIGTLIFAEFGKFREAGTGIAFSLFVMLCATMTLTPALLRLAGPWVFWPWGLGVRQQEGYDADRRQADWHSGPSSPFQSLWQAMGGILQRRPGTIWLATVLVLSPFAGLAIINYDNVNYGPIQDLPSGASSVLGTKVLTRHFPVGYAGPLTLLLRNDRVDFSGKDGLGHIRKLAEELKRRRGDLKIADLRSVADPLGISRAAREALSRASTLPMLFQPLVLARAIEHYVSNTKELDHHLTRMDLVLAVDPFTRRTINHLDVIEDAIRRELPEGLGQGTELYLTGATASLRDLKTVAEQDRERINLLVTVSVLAVLVVLLRRLAIPIYLIVSVVFGYLVTLGVTFAVFRFLAGGEFPGLDWTVPIFLFTLLIAVGEDYNIILVTRVDEEHDRHGPLAGVTEALAKTGGIISGCGFIMAGTFSALAFGGSLARMYQLGFALTFGVLLDTFIVRPILVPAYLILVNSGRFGRLGTYLGTKRESKAMVQT
jgi:putative drug exporter of the RND superfamily